MNGVNNNLLFAEKVFGTLNHPRRNFNSAKSAIDKSKGIIKAIEIFNMGMNGGEAENILNRKLYDDLLRAGYRLFGVAVVDWPSYIKDAVDDRVRGCNVLYFDPSFNSLTMIQKQEAALDAYINGAYYAAGYGDQYIKDLSIQDDVVNLSVSGLPSSINVITNIDTETFANLSEITKTIEKGITYVRFECYYKDGDFIFTNPIWFDEN